MRRPDARPASRHCRPPPCPLLRAAAGAGVVRLIGYDFASGGRGDGRKPLAVLSSFVLPLVAPTPEPVLPPATDVPQAPPSPPGRPAFVAGPPLRPPNPRPPPLPGTVVAAPPGGFRRPPSPPLGEDALGGACVRRGGGERGFRV